MTLSWKKAVPGGLVAILVAALSTGCSGDKQPGADGGTAVTDSGSPSGDDGGGGESDAGPADAGDGGSGNPGIGETGSMCNADTDCASLICLASHVCSLTCEGANNCPNTSWSCGNDGSRTGVCVCAKTEGGDDICDGVDNDCNGVIDDRETAVCPGRRTCYQGECTCAPEDTCGPECVDKQTNPKHCGECGNACGEGSVCQGANCVCNGQICGAACVDTTSDNLNCNGCGLACGRNDDCAQSACSPADREWARWQVNPGFIQGASNNEIIDFDTHLVWEAQYQPTLWSQAEAVDYCVNLPHPPDSVWRVPTRIELLSIIDFDRALGTGSAAISPGFTMATTGSPPNTMPFWTSTFVADGTQTRYWIVDFVDGRLNSAATSKNYVRCVRQDLN